MPQITLDLTDREVQQLREAIDVLPLRTHITLVVKVTKALPMESVAEHASADSPPPVSKVLETGGGVRVTAFTPRGVSVLDQLERVLARIPHGGEGSL